MSFGRSGLLVAMPLVAELLRAAGQMRLRFAVAVHLGVLLVALVPWFRRRAGGARAFALVAAAGVLVAAVPLMLGAVRRDLYTTASVLSPLLAGLAGAAALAPWITPARSRADPPAAPASSPVDAILIFAGTMAVLIGIRVAAYGDFDLMLDEVLYVLQSRWLGEPGFGLAVDSEIRQHLGLRLVYEHDSRLYAQYPPGWPLLLALFASVGLLSFAPAALGALSATLCYLLVSERHGRWSGVAAAVLLASQQWFLEHHQGFQSHALTMVLALAAAWLWIRGLRAPRRWGDVQAGLAGLCAGLAVTARPLTGLSLLIGLAAWGVLAERAPAATRRRAVFWLGAGAIGPLLLLLAYQNVTTGSPFVPGYTRVHGDLHALGFGLRGFAGLLTWQFTPADALVTLFTRASDFIRHAVGPGLLVPVLALAALAGARPSWRTIVPFLSLPVLHFFYFYGMLRFYIELLPFVVIVWVVMVRGLFRNHARVTAALVLAAIAGNVLFAPAWRFGDMRRADPRSIPVVRQLADRAVRERLLVLLDTAGANPGNRDPFYTLMGTMRDTRPIVLDYFGPADTLLIRRWPDRTPVLVTFDPRGGASAADLPLPPAAARR